MVDDRLPPYKVSLAGVLLAAREAVMEPIRPFLRQANVTEQQWRVLRVLGDEGELDSSTLAQHAILHAPSVTRITRELVDRGLLSRAADAADGRRSILKLTGAGRDLVDRTAEYTGAILGEYKRVFGPERLAALTEELSALQRALDGVRHPREDVDA